MRVRVAYYTQWNLKANEDLPEYMKPIYSAMFTFGNELADQNYGLNTLPLIKKEWENLCKSYMVEARWFYGGYTPTLEEYLKNAWTSAESERGDVAKSVHCYMEEKGISEGEAQEYIKGFICYSWKKISEESAKATIPKSIVNMSLNMARTAHCIFQHGDGIGTSVGVTKDRLVSLITNPIPIDDDDHHVIFMLHNNLLRVKFDFNNCIAAPNVGEHVFA
ncbi:hypothetical protein ACLB2K_062136 [Fragaria x ananassa]